EYSGIAILHAPPQRLERADLQLFDRAFGAAEPARRLADAAFVDEAVDDHGALRLRQRVDEPVEPRALLLVIEIVIGPRVARPLRHAVAVDDFAPRLLHPIGQGIGRDPDEPGAKRCAARLPGFEAREGAVEDVRRQLLGRVTVADAADEERVD